MVKILHVLKLLHPLPPSCRKGSYTPKPLLKYNPTLNELPAKASQPPSRLMHPNKVFSLSMSHALLLGHSNTPDKMTARPSSCMPAPMDPFLTELPALVYPRSHHLINQPPSRFQKTRSLR